ncbi:MULTISPECIES: glycine betaine ABC transporter substrate-binding protein [Psychrilyobacter]|uniref:Glycine/betaine ABC transporter substrate-binding protein n=1 Tax=Psychrilyobacter piezotolerans TaxID=2293438 RepID=A0ABX9KK25_9FUSO|nr:MULTISPECIES: glycine betaine ABC transporter substrate-binding protein [Psychrilyobacter]MCS5421756.1 glycine/betaine ABC transporter substrate-binding protein [Psychrilyobacter sp. S5]NDI77061.1 glycine/betaine ABC transporter substrate-binding protein [Psychrilyobacter piezotolerans]RDE64677.1 glycine/betaine ABC transporter substrate-binding protein [Psychrilyobacter sp. S5]REI42489.1 glycine/betaine ABC transporter substrate-binding protein [Psychrilyobacter piezotolerans]
MNKLFKNVVLIMTIMVFAACGKKEAEVETIKIGHKNYTEQRVLGQLFAVMIENHTDYKTDVKELGGTKIVFEALKSGDIDLYPEFSGTAYVALLNESGLKDPSEVHKLVKDRLKAENNLDYLNPLGYNNTYTLAVRTETAEKYNLKTFSDIAKVSNELVIGATMEFLEREDGMLGLKKVYPGMEFKNEKGLDGGLRYTAIKDGVIDAADAFSTDGKLIAYNLVILEDDKNFFPPYYVAPLLNGEFAATHPDIVEILGKLSGQINEKEMQNMNYRVAEEGIPTKIVAEEFLKKKGLL